MPDLTPSPLDTVVLPQFANAAAYAGVFEMKVRLLADNTEPLRKLAIKNDLEPLTKRLVEHFEQDLTSRERDILKGCVRLRNKLFHLDLSCVKGKLQALNVELALNTVTAIDLNTGERFPVSNLSTEKGRVYGWLWESASSGAFREAVGKFGEAIGVLDRLAEPAAFTRSDSSK
jgi:hypothetical protein